KSQISEGTKVQKVTEGKTKSQISENTVIFKAVDIKGIVSARDSYSLTGTKTLYSFTANKINETVTITSFYGERYIPGEPPTTPPTTPPPTDDTLILTPPPVGAVLGANRPVEAEGTVLGARRSGSVLGARRGPGAVLGKRRSPKTADAAMGGIVAGMMLSMMTAFGGATVLKKKREDEVEE
nr:hypothetical protein [Lachnospiraceae bacterium]